MKEMIEQRRKRAKAIKEYGTLRKAVEQEHLSSFRMSVLAKQWF